MKLLAEIVDLYETPLLESSPISFSFDYSPEEVERIQRVTSNIAAVVQDKKKNLGIAHIRPISLSKEDADALRAAIKEDENWIENYKQLISTMAPEVSDSSLEDQLATLHIPWWNAVLLSRKKDHYDGKSLKIEGTLSHSYINFLMRYGKIPRVDQDQASSIGVLVTSDDLIVIGCRGGHTYPDIFHCVPAGFVEAGSGEEHLFRTIYAEALEETGLSREQFSRVELIGRVFDHTIAHNSLYVFEMRTSLTFGELQRHWYGSIDQVEHKFLVGLPDDEDIIFDFIRKNPYDPDKADPVVPSKTTLANANSLMPPGSITLMMYYRHKNGKEWARGVEGQFEGNYKLLA